MTATPEDIRDAVADDMLTGEAERQLADRRVRYFAPEERIKAASLLAAASSTTGPFIRIGLKSREF
jgi:hypothetical protein